MLQYVLWKGAIKIQGQCDGGSAASLSERRSHGRHGRPTCPILMFPFLPTLRNNDARFCLLLLAFGLHEDDDGPSQMANNR